MNTIFNYFKMSSFLQCSSNEQLINKIMTTNGEKTLNNKSYFKYLGHKFIPSPAINTDTRYLNQIDK